MEKIIYIQLLDEGTIVYRPVPAREIENNIYEMGGYDIYNPEEGDWEFLPGTYVLVEKQYRGGEKLLVAIKQQSPV